MRSIITILLVAAISCACAQSQANRVLLERHFIYEIRSYQDLITDADWFYKKNKLREAQVLYVQASKLFPEKSLPKSQLERIADVIGEPEDVGIQKPIERIVINTQPPPDNNTTANNPITETKPPPEEKKPPPPPPPPVKKGPTYSELMYQADSATAKRDLNAAINLYNRALKLQPGATLPTNKIAELTAKLNAEREKDNRYLQLISQGNAKLKADEYSEAYELFLTANAIKPHDVKARSKLTELDNRYKALISKGDSLMNRGRLSQAMFNYERSLKVKPNEAHPIDMIATIKARLEEVRHGKKSYDRGVQEYNLQNYDKAIEEFTAMLEIDSNHYDSRIARGMAKYNLDDNQGALDDYNYLLRLGEKKEQVYLKIAEVKDYLSDTDGAMEALNAAIEYNPSYKAAYINRGLTYADNLKDYSSAMTDFNKALEIDPKYADAYYQRAWVEITTGKLDEAATDIDKAEKFRYARVYIDDARKEINRRRKWAEEEVRIEEEKKNRVVVEELSTMKILFDETPFRNTKDSLGDLNIKRMLQYGDEIQVKEIHDPWVFAKDSGVLRYVLKKWVAEVDEYEEIEKFLGGIKEIGGLKDYAAAMIAYLKKEEGWRIKPVTHRSTDMVFFTGFINGDAHRDMAIVVSKGEQKKLVILIGGEKVIIAHERELKDFDGIKKATKGEKYFFGKLKQESSILEKIVNDGILLTRKGKADTLIFYELGSYLEMAQ